AVADGDRVAVLRGSHREPPVPAAGGARGALRVLDALVRWYARPPGDDAGLEVGLDHAARLLRPGARLLVLADPASVAAVPAARWPAVAARHEVTVVLLTDPLEMAPPEAMLAFVADGGGPQRRSELDLSAPAQRARRRAALADRVAAPAAERAARGGAAGPIAAARPSRTGWRPRRRNWRRAACAPSRSRPMRPATPGWPRSAADGAGAAASRPASVGGAPVVAAGARLVGGGGGPRPRPRGAARLALVARAPQAPGRRALRRRGRRRRDAGGGGRGHVGPAAPGCPCPPPGRRPAGGHRMAGAPRRGPRSAPLCRRGGRAAGRRGLPPRRRGGGRGGPARGRARAFPGMDGGPARSALAVAWPGLAGLPRPGPLPALPPPELARVPPPLS